MSGDGIDLASFRMVSRHLSAYSASLYCERGYLTSSGTAGQPFKPFRSAGEFTSLTLKAAGPTFRKSGPPSLSPFFFYFGAPGTILFGAAGNIQDGRRRGHLFHGGMSPLASLVLSDARTLFSSVSQSELVCLKRRLDFVQLLRALLHWLRPSL